MLRTFLFAAPKSFVTRSGSQLQAVLTPCRSRLPVRRTLVWHAGFEQSKEAQKIAREIQAMEAQKKHSDDKILSHITAKQEQRLAELKNEYEKITGEPYDDSESGPPTKSPISQ